MGERVWPVVVAAVVVVAGLLAVLPGEDGDGTDAGRTGPRVVADFLAAYERSRTATFVAEQTFTRTTPDGASLGYERRLVQRPPDDRLVVGAGAADGRLDGRVVRCSTRPDGASGCVEGPVARPYDEEVAAEVAALERLVRGDDALYEVAAGAPGCFSLHVRFVVLTPPYGDRAGFCFDEATGAPLRFEVQRPEAVDLVETVSVSATVRAGDLRLGDLGNLPTTTTTTATTTT